MEKEKEFRTKFQSQLKSHSDTVESLQVRFVLHKALKLKLKL